MICFCVYNIKDSSERKDIDAALHSLYKVKIIEFDNGKKSLKEKVFEKVE